ncbi:MAG: hypothetical protein V1678_01880, partial [Candidatus Aenigmatarchaeota archaeon]
FWAAFIVSVAFCFMALPAEHSESAQLHGYLHFLENKAVDGEVLSMHPTVVAYTDAKVTPMYFPVFNADLSAYWLGYLSKKDAAYIFIDTCEGGMLCPPADIACEKAKDNLVEAITKKYKKAYSEESNGCYYWVFSRTQD